ncbi:GyrI-like domain-containing protein [Prevotella sp. 10(H)]|uniref:GyrI-like domain-containing protein n=1 Tax=Prevotella sp. 10(H) TaxID=1158294 RepID=UPI0004A6C7B9|nr:GyrI-like domain-containing protein [Prevotella sp. 10(H)]
MDKRYCQSCGMPLNNPDWLGTNNDSSKSDEYCYYCLKDGEYIVDVSMDEMIDIWIKYSDEFNNYAKSELSKKEIGELLRKRLPKLKRWRRKSETADTYHQAINNVTAYINGHLFDALDLKVLSGIACLSEFHFHRIFRAITGENTGEYIQRLRLEYVAHKLLTTNMSITRITELTSYNSVYTLSRAFKNHFGVSPSVYRSQTNGLVAADNRPYAGKPKLIPRIVKIEQMDIIYINIRDAYRFESRYRSVWQRLMSYVDRNNLKNDYSKFVSISFDDPTITPIRQCRFYIGMTICEDVKANGRFGIMQIPQGLYAVFRYKGAYSDLYKLYHDIYLEWLPVSDYQLRNTFSFEVYINTPLEARPEELITEVYIPVEKISNEFRKTN